MLQSGHFHTPRKAGTDPSVVPCDRNIREYKNKPPCAAKESGAVVVRCVQYLPVGPAIRDPSVDQRPQLQYSRLHLQLCGRHPRRRHRVLCADLATVTPAPGMARLGTSLFPAVLELHRRLHVAACQTGRDGLTGRPGHRTRQRSHRCWRFAASDTPHLHQTQACHADIPADTDHHHCR